MNKDKELEEAVKTYKELKKYKKSIKNIDTDFFFKFAETVLKELERYKRLAEANLKDSEEFKNNMCEHRCILKSELQELQENSIPKDIIRQKINERKFELQQEYEDFEDDIRLNTLREIYYLQED